jgi:DNA-binding Lrp family transcriptional regulator
MQYDYIDSDIIQMLQGDIPLCPHPFGSLAAKLGVTEEDIVDRIRVLQEKGIIRRCTAILRHQQAGYDCNAMVAWKVEESKADRVAQDMVLYDEISHCYLRDVPEDFAFNFFTMVHARSEEELNAIIASIAGRSGLNDFIVIKSLKEFKKVSMEYIK